MGFLDGLLGRRKPARPNLDALFAIPSAAITLQVSMDFLATGQGAVAFRSVEGRAFADIEAEVRALLDADGGPPVKAVEDHYGYTWVVVTTDPPDVGSVVTDPRFAKLPMLLETPKEDAAGTSMDPVNLAKLRSFLASVGA